MSYDLKEPTQKGNCLHRVTHRVTIIAVLSSVAFVYIAAILGPTPYDYDPKWFWIIAIIAVPFILFTPLYIAWIPFSMVLVLREWRLLAGIYLVAVSVFFIGIISYSWAIYSGTDNWDKYDSWIIYFSPHGFLPAPAVFFILCSGGRREGRDQGSTITLNDCHGE